MRLTFKFRDKIREKFSPKVFAQANAGDVMAFLSLCAFAIVLIEFIEITNYTAVISTFPLWIVVIVLGAPAVLSWVMFNSKLGLLTSLAWCVLLVSSNDHLPALSRMGQELPDVPLNDVQNCFGVISFNCYTLRDLDPEPFKGKGARLILLQEIRPYHDIEEFAREVFGADTRILRSNDCAIIANGGTAIRPDLPPNNPGDPAMQIAIWSPDMNTPPIRIVNVSLEYVDPFRSVFKPSSWRYYSDMRHRHRKHIDNIINALRNLESKDGELPLLVGGSFSVQAASPIFKPFEDKLTDAYLESGNSYGATFPADFPVFRFDRIFCSSLIKFRQHDTIYVRGCHRQAVYAEIFPNLH